MGTKFSSHQAKFETLGTPAGVDVCPSFFHCRKKRKKNRSSIVFLVCRKIVFTFRCHPSLWELCKYPTASQHVKRKPLGFLKLKSLHTT